MANAGLAALAKTTPMKILVANLGSTSFKYRLFDLPERAGDAGAERELARGGVE